MAKITKLEGKRLDELLDQPFSDTEIQDMICKEFGRETLDRSTIYRRRHKKHVRDEEVAPSFGRWVNVTPDDSWRWWPSDTVRRCPECQCLNLRTASICQKCGIVFGS